MALITTGFQPKALWPGIHAWWGVSYNEHGQEWRDLVDVETSNRNYEEDVETGGFGYAPVKQEGAAIAYDAPVPGFTKRYTHVTYGLAFAVTREEIEDNLYGERAMRRAQQLGFSMRQTKEVVVANIYNRAFNSSYVGGDGKELVATDHPTASGTFSNELSPAADLSEAALEDLFIQMGNATNSRGMRIAIKPRKLILNVAGQFEAARILQSTGQVDTANNNINAIKSMGMLPGGVVVNHYLTDTDAYFVTTDVPNGPKLFQRRAAEFADDNDFDTENRKHKGTERYSVGWTDPRGVWGSPGA